MPKWGGGRAIAMALRGRPGTAETCRHQTVVTAGGEKKAYVCLRRRGHKDDHSHGQVRWPQERSR